ncbi:MAG TPA: tetratricopeptide repeat protein, partial [Stellaceae bacterium]|nr:tetratricopeptide repeat protein [Stellaceae bacterium]
QETWNSPTAESTISRLAIDAPDLPSRGGELRATCDRLLRIWAGEPDIAIEHLETSLHLSPHARIGLSRTDLGTAHFYSRRFDEAEPKLLLAIQEDPSFPLPYRILAACYAHMGRLEEAREIVERLRANTPVVIPNRTSYLRNPEHRELLLAGLRLAAGETT